MKLNKYFVIPAIALAIVSAGAYGLTKVNAAETDNMPPFMQGLAERFGLNQDDVHEYMEQRMDERHEMMEARHEDRLNNLVENGTITAEQKTMLDAKHEEMEQAREEARNLDPAERREKMHELRDEMHQWAQDNGIDMPMDGARHGMRMGKGFGMHRGFEMSDLETQTN